MTVTAIGIGAALFLGGVGLVGVGLIVLYLGAMAEAWRNRDWLGLYVMLGLLLLGSGVIVLSVSGAL